MDSLASMRGHASPNTSLASLPVASPNTSLASLPSPDTSLSLTPRTAASSAKPKASPRPIDSSLLVSKKPVIVEDRSLGTDHVAIHDRPWRSDVIVQRNDTGTTGVYGVGMKVDVPVGNSANVPRPFAVKNCSGLRDAQGRDMSGQVSLGDILCFCNDRSVAKEGESIIETTIFGEKDSLLKLTFKNAKTGQLYDKTVKRHVPIREWSFEHQWYDVKDEFRRKELLTDSTIVEHLNGMRSTIIDPEGREMDFLAGIRKRGSHTGIHFANDRAATKTVLRVVPGSPAWFAGVQKGDVITGVDAVSGEHVAELLGGTERIGTPCKLSYQRAGVGQREVEMSRTQYSAMTRTEELLEWVEGNAALDGATRQSIMDKVRELEKERQYEERVMAARLNKSHSEILRHLHCACETLLPPRADLTDSLLASQHSAADTERELRRAKERNEELNALVNDLSAEVDRLKAAMAAMVPKGDLEQVTAELNKLRAELSAMETERASMVPRAELTALRSEMKAQLDRLRDDKVRLQQELKASEDEKTKLAEENEELRRKLKALEGEKAGLCAEMEALRKELKDLRDLSSGSDVQLDSLKRQLQSLTKEAESLRAKALEGERERGVLTTENFELKRKLTSALDENGELKAEVEALRKKLKEEKAEGDRLAAERDASARKLKAAEMELEELRKLAAELKKQGTGLEDLNHELQAQVELGKRNAEGLSKDLAEAQSKLKAARQEAGELSAKLDQASKALKNAEAEIAGLKREVEGLGRELKGVRAENVELVGDLETSKRMARELQDKVGELEKEREVLGRQAEAARKSAEEAQEEVRGLGLKLRASEDKVTILGAEKTSLENQLKEAKERESALLADVQRQKEATAAVQEELRKAKKQAAELQSALEERTRELSKAKDAHAKTQQELAAVEKQLMDATNKVATLQKEVAEKKDALAAAAAEKKKLEKAAAELNKKLAEAEEQLQAAANKLTKQQTELDKRAKLLEDAQKRVAEEEKDHAETREQLRALLQELAAAELDGAAARKEFLDGITAAPAHTTASVLRAMKTARKLPTTTLDKLVDMWETMARDSSVAPAQVHALLLKLLEGKPARGAQELAEAVDVMNQEKPWSVEVLKSGRGVLGQEGVSDVEGLQAKYQQKIREMLKPQFESPDATCSASTAVVVRGLPGSTIFVTLRAEASAPTSNDFDLSGPSPLEVPIEESCVVTACARVEEFMSEAASQEFAIVEAPPPPAPPQTLVGVGMRLHRQHRADAAGEEFDEDGEPGIELGAEIVVTEIYDSGEVEHEGSIKVGDWLVEVDGVSVQHKTMDEISALIIGPANTEVVLLMERPAGLLWDSGHDLNPHSNEGSGKSVHVHDRGTRFEAKLTRREERFGVGMVASRRAGADHGEVLVKQIFEGSPVALDGTIAVGDAVVEIDGQAVEFLSMPDVWVLFTGQEGSQVTLLMEKKELVGSRHDLCADGLYTVTLTRARHEEKAQPKTLQETVISVLDSGKNLFESVGRTLGAVTGEDRVLREKELGEKEDADRFLSDAIAKYREMLKLQTLAPEKVPILEELETVSNRLRAPTELAGTRMVA